ncbi:MAG: hypothetical protein R3Y54_12560 [Eubacteriales bacterium]
MDSIKNQKGASLMEVVAGFTIVTIVTAAILTCVLAGFSLNYKTLTEYTRVSVMYDQIEGNETVVTDWSESPVGAVSFTWMNSSGVPVDVVISGKYVLDKEQQKLGEFIGD